jgi:hypothetical protein
LPNRVWSLFAASLLVAGCLSALTSSPAAARSTARAVNGPRVSKHLRAAIAGLRVETPKRGGYARSKFTLWDDADHDCRNTRAEVLAAESTRKVTGRCTIKKGRWTSYYDGRTYTRAAKLDIDHLVPLEEAWASGARSWSSAKREAYANDLTEKRTLVAVSAHANRSKVDRDPAHWMSARHRCRYVNQWVVVKLRWSLTVDRAEKATLAHVAAHCPNVVLRTHLAKVVSTGSGHGTGHGSGHGTGHGSGGLDPRFDTCTEAKAHGYGPYRRGKDPEYAWYEDRDGDGIVCE